MPGRILRLSNLPSIPAAAVDDILRATVCDAVVYYMLAPIGEPDDEPDGMAAVIIDGEVVVILVKVEEGRIMLSNESVVSAVCFVMQRLAPPGHDFETLRQSIALAIHKSMEAQQAVGLSLTDPASKN